MFGRRVSQRAPRRKLRWEPNDPDRIRYGCFLPDLTGLASGLPAGSREPYGGQRAERQAPWSRD